MPTDVNFNFDVDVSDALDGLEDLQDAFAGIDRAFGRLRNSVSGITNLFKSSARQTNLFRKALAGLSGVAIGKYLADATKEGIEYYETVNLFNVAMKESIDDGKEFIATMSDMYGLDPKSLMDYTGLFYEMAYAVNVPQKAAEKLSMNLTRMTTDVSSLFNTELDRVADNLMSGMRGMSRAVLKYGMDLRATTVEAYANANGIKAQFETMNEASREILRYLVMLEQANDAQTDFAETIESPANQLRIFKEQSAQLGRAVSRFIITPLSIALPVINGFVAALRIMVDTLATLLGFNYDYGAIRGVADDSDGATEGLESVGSAADSTGKKIKKLLAPFDELNVLSQETGSGSGSAGFGLTEIDPAILKLLEESEYKMKAIRLEAWKTRDAVLAFFGYTPDGDSWIYSADIFESNLKKKFPSWEKTISALFDFDYKAFLSNVQLLFNSFKRIGVEAISIVFDDLQRLLGIEVTDSSLATWIENLNAKFFDFRSKLTDNEGSIANFIAKTVELGVAFSVFATLADVLTPFLVFFGALGFFASQVIPVVTAGFGLLQSALGGIVGLFTKLTRTYVYFSTSLGGLPIIIEGMASTLLPIVALVVAGFIDGFAQIWNKSETFRDNFGTLVSNIGLMVMSIASMFKSAFKLAWEIVEPFVSGLGDLFQPIYPFVVSILNNIVGAITGIVTVLDGIFQGDLTLVFKGLKMLIASVAQTITDIFVAIGNAIISVFVGAINFVGNLIYKFVCGVVSAINMVGELIGISIPYPDRSIFTVDEIPTIVAPVLDFATFATGGVVTGPTRALIGEAGRDEMVMPLDNSPQMYDFIDKIADRVSGREQVVKVYIGDREWDAFTYESSQRGKNLVGAQPIREGRA